MLEQRLAQGFATMSLVAVNGSEKLGGSLLDAEIAGQRTMISYRQDLTVKKMVFRAENVELKNVQIAPLKD